MFYCYRFVGEQTLGKLEATVNYDHFNKVDMVVEAVFEDIGIKHKVIKEVEQVRFLSENTCNLFSSSCNITPSS